MQLESDDFCTLTSGAIEVDWVGKRLASSDLAVMRAFYKGGIRLRRLQNIFTRSRVTLVDMSLDSKTVALK